MMGPLLMMMVMMMVIVLGVFIRALMGCKMKAVQGVMEQESVCCKNTLQTSVKEKNRLYLMHHLGGGRSLVTFSNTTNQDGN